MCHFAVKFYLEVLASFSAQNYSLLINKCLKRIFMFFFWYCSIHFKHFSVSQNQVIFILVSHTKIGSNSSWKVVACEFISDVQFYSDKQRKLWPQDIDLYWMLCVQFRSAVTLTTSMRHFVSVTSMVVSSKVMDCNQKADVIYHLFTVTVKDLNLYF